MTRREALAAWPHCTWLLWAMYGLGLGGALLAMCPLAQDPAFHAFADTRTLWRIPYFGDVVSNAALLVAGLAGLAALRRRAGEATEQGARSAWARAVQTLFFGAVVLTAFGSTYYHWAPDTPRLFWDRLPLGLVASASVALVLTDRASIRGAGRWALVAWLALGPITVVYWRITEAQGAGDLRPYFLMLGVAMAAAPVLLALLPPRHTHGYGYLLAAALYIIATVCEQADRGIYEAIGVVSGHTLKHVAAAAAVAVLAWMFARRASPVPRA